MTVRVVVVAGSSPLYTVSTSNTATTGSSLDDVHGMPIANGRVTLVTRPVKTALTFRAAWAFDTPAQLQANATRGDPAKNSVMSSSGQ